MARSKDLPPSTSGYVGRFFKDQLYTNPRPTPSNIDLTKQVALVTGASSGLGLESARQLLALGVSHLIIAVRSDKRGQAAVEKIRSANPVAKIEVWPLEMESYQSVQSFAQRCQAELSRLDTVILNAGIAEMTFGTAPSTGHEIVMQVNYHSTVLLSILLLPVLKAKAATAVVPKLTIVNSAMASFTSLPNRDRRPFLQSFDNTDTTPWDGSERYNASKLVCQFFISRLADVVSPDDVIINMVEPGLTKGTSLFRNVKGPVGWVFAALKSSAARPVDVGALTYIDAAAVKGKESHGCLLINCETAPLAALTYGDGGKALFEIVWEESLDEFNFVGARDIVRSFGGQA